EEAIHQYEFILKLNPNDIDAYLGLSYIYLNQKKFEDCIEMLKQAQANKENWKVVVTSGVLTSEKIEQRKNAKEVQVYLVLGLAYAQDEQQKKAIEAYQKAIEAQPDSGLAYFYLGAIYEQSGKRQKAYGALEKSVEFDQCNPDALNYLGYMYADDGIELNKAQGLIEQALKIDPDNAAYTDSLGWVYFKKGMLDEALVEVEKAAGLIEDAEVFEHLGDIYRVKGQLNKAEEAWKKSLELNPERKSAQEKLKQWLILQKK
ncbi:MAG: tetratricopeptide repeat protein, partial [Dehalococcoidia bacterium]